MGIIAECSASAETVRICTNAVIVLFVLERTPLSIRKTLNFPSHMKRAIPPKFNYQVQRNSVGLLHFITFFSPFQRQESHHDSLSRVFGITT
jgi:hypothetical protein